AVDDRLRRLGGGDGRRPCRGSRTVSAAEGKAGEPAVQDAVGRTVGNRTCQCGLRPDWGVLRSRSGRAGVEGGREATKRGGFREPERSVLLGKHRPTPAVALT